MRNGTTIPHSAAADPLSSRSAFLDPSCFSSFTPTAGTNAFRLQLPVDAGQQVDSALFCLATGEVSWLIFRRMMSPN